MKKAFLLGASGFIGSYLLDELLRHPMYERVTVVVRKPLNVEHSKLKMLIGDFSSIASLKPQIEADDVFIAMGTTRKKTPDVERYYQIDHDYPVLAARLARENGATGIFAVTAVGADASSKAFYLRTKGEIERDLIALKFSRTHLFEPSMLLGEREEFRAFEKALIRAWPLTHPLFAGGLSRFRGIEGRDVAYAMIAAAKSDEACTKVYRWREMMRILGRES